MIMTLRKNSIPWAMAGGRALLGPILIVGERCGWSGVALASIVVSALVSDIFDGVLARKWQCDTAGVRLFDSMADTVFYVSVGVALWVGQPRLWHDNAILLGILLAPLSSEGQKLAKIEEPAEQRIGAFLLHPDSLPRRKVASIGEAFRQPLRFFAE